MGKKLLINTLDIYTTRNDTMRTLVTILALLAVSLSASNTLGAVIVRDASNNATGIDDLDVMGMVFDVTFSAGSFDTVFGAGNPPTPNEPFFLGDETGATAARDNIIALFNAATPAVPNVSPTDSTIVSGNFFIPYALTPSSELTKFAYVGGTEISGWSSTAKSDASRGAVRVFATFVKQQGVIPEPTALVTWLLLMGSLACCRMRRHRAVARATL